MVRPVYGHGPMCQALGQRGARPAGPVEPCNISRPPTVQDPFVREGWRTGFAPYDASDAGFKRGAVAV
jgi:hypothetical protein